MRASRQRGVFVGLLLAAAWVWMIPIGVASAASPIEDLLAGRFRWNAGPPLLAPAKAAEDSYYSVKDPTIVQHDGQWHVFCTVRGVKRSHQIEYIRLADLKGSEPPFRKSLALSDGYYCAPQVFYFRPQKLWYMIYQIHEASRKPGLQPAWSTTTQLADPGSWTKPVLLFEQAPKVQRWIDFWVICDERNAHLFCTSNDGQMWRSHTPVARFPAGWSQPELALKADIFEASHTYRLKGLDKYLTLIEAQAGGRRYYKAYLADRLEGPWQGVADRLDKPFAAPGNVAFSGPRWTDSFSHGELLREECDERLEFDPARLRFLYQGVSDADKNGKRYGEIPWRLGLLEAAR